MSREIRQEMLLLMEKKDKIENDIKNLTLILNQNGVGMHESLVDTEGYPKNNIDVYQVRHARQQIICLQNDHKALMRQIENGLGTYYSNTSGNSSDNNISMMETERSEITLHKTPFAKITVVSPGSPAEHAGLQPDDCVVEFGSVNATNFKNITDIATVVQHTVGSQVNIKLKRGERYLSVQLIPKKWSGNGLLGCNIVAL